MKVRLSADLLTGLLFVALGGFAIVYGSRYALGHGGAHGARLFSDAGQRRPDADRPCPGRPLLARHGRASSAPSAGAPWCWCWPACWPSGSSSTALGLLAAGIVLVVAARLADREFRWLETALLAVGLTLAAAAVFLYGLGLPIKLLRL